MTAEQYGEQFGVAPEDIAKISAWLTSHGFTVDDPTASRMVISFSGNAGQVREAFDTEIHKLVVNGIEHIANVRDPSIPVALAPAIEGVVSLHDFRPKPAFVPKPQFTVPNPGGIPFYAGRAGDLATIYNFNPIYAAGITWKGQTIALIQDTDLYTMADWTMFRSIVRTQQVQGRLIDDDSSLAKDASTLALTAMTSRPSLTLNWRAPRSECQY